MNDNLKLIVGLGNPGPSYTDTRHNAGQLFVERIAKDYNIALKAEGKYFGLWGKGFIGNQEIKLLIPTAFMNCSGKSVSALAQFYKIDTAHILVAHDELDFNPGLARIKQGGGHGGHNGLRDIIASCANQKDFYRLRLGIGHPGNTKQVSSFVLKKAPPKEHEQILASIDESIRYLPQMISGEWAKVMNKLHAFNASD